MYRIARAAAAAAWALSLGACAIHPLPEDYAGVSTADIVRHIRCEARDGMRDKLVQYLFLRGSQGVPNALALARDLQERTLSLNDFTKRAARELDTLTLFRINTFAQAAIAYNFKLDMSETNNLGTTIDLLKPLTNGTATVAIGAGFDRTRQNIRSFTITDNYSKLVNVMPDFYCNGQARVRNYVYPITGTIGINEMIDTFVDLALFEGLAPKPASADAGKGTALVTAFAAMKKKAAPSAPPAPPLLAMGDTIVFTTKLSGSAIPKVVFTAVGRGLSVADANLNASASRTDVHQVIVAMSVPAPQPLPAIRSLSTTPLVQLARPVGATPEERVLEVIGEHIYRFEPRPLSNGIIIAP